MAMDLTITIKAINAASAAIGQVQSQIEKLQNSGKKAGKVGESIQGFGKAASKYATLPIAGALGFAAKSAIEFESAMTNVAKLANLDDKQTAAMGKEILKMSRTTPISAAGLAEIAASGASLGIATKDLKGFVDVTAKMATSFDMTADQAGNAIAKLRNVYSLDAKGGVKQTSMLGDVINTLGDNTAAREADIVNSMTRIGGAARNFGFGASEAAALSAAVISMGNAPEVAATAINSWLPTLQTASKQPPKFQAALKSLGLDAQQLEKDIGKDAPAAFQNFVKAIGKVPPAARAAALKDLFGSGSDASILASMANDTTQLAKAFQLAKATKPGGMMQTFEKNSATTANQMQLLKNNVAEVGITLGSALLPAINSVLKAVQPMVQGFADFAQANPGIVKIGVAIAALVAAIGPVAIGIGSLIGAFGQIGGAVSAVGKLGTAFKALKAVGNIGKIGGAFKGIGTALAGIGGKAAGVAGAFKGFAMAAAPAAALGGILAGVVYGVVQIGAALTGTTVTFQDFTSTITSSLMALPANLAALPAAIGAIFSAVVTSVQLAFVNMGLSIKIAFLQAKAAVMSGITAMMTMFSTIGAQLGAIFSGIGAMIAGAFAQVQAVFMQAGMMIQMVFMQIVMSIQMAVMQIIMVFQQIGAGISAAIASIMATLSSLGAQIGAVFSSMAAAVSSAMAGVVSAISSGMASAVSAVTSAGSAMVGAIQGIAGQMFAAGAAIVQQLIAGITSQIGAAQGAIANLASSIRGALPFSPAKWGPLSDIDKTGYGLVNTFAAGIQPGPLMSSLGAALMPVAGMLNQPLGTPTIGTGAATAGAGAGIGGSGINITYSPQISMGAGGEGQDFKALLQEHSKELVGLLQNEQRRLERTQYVPGGSVI